MTRFGCGHELNELQRLNDRDHATEIDNAHCAGRTPAGPRPPLVEMLMFPRPQARGSVPRSVMNRVTVLPVLLLLLAARAFGAATTVLDVYVDMENSTDGAPVTTNMLNACTAGSGGRWVTSANPMT